MNFFTISHTYNVNSVKLLDCMGETINKFKSDKENSNGRFKHLQILGAASVAGMKLTAYSISLIVVLPFEKLLELVKRIFSPNDQPIVNDSVTNNTPPQKPTATEIPIPPPPLSPEEFNQLGARQIIGDFKEYSESGKDLRAVMDKVRAFVQAEGLFIGASNETKKKYINQAAATYTSSRLHYAPVVAEWVKSVLDTAVASKSDNDLPCRVIFLARDGIPAYEVAKKMKAANENYKDVPVTLLYISRKVKDWAQSTFENKEMLVQYAKQEGIESGQKCLFIDVGFFGSMIDPIREIFAGITKDIEFGYLVSHTPKAHGFMGSTEHKLSSIITAGGNPAAHWLEDNHQGVTNSPHKLAKKSVTLGQPNVRHIMPVYTNEVGEENCKKSQPESYLYKHFAMQAVLDGFADVNDTSSLETSTAPQLWRMASVESKTKFDNFLTKYFDRQRVSFTKHF